MDLGWSHYNTAPPAIMADVRIVLGSFRGLRSLIDLAGIAIGGGLFIVPAFAAVQAWAGADRRARVVAAVNVLNAAFMVAGTLGVSLLQKAGAGTAALFLALGAANLAVAFAIARSMPASAKG
jgi:acyl-[acyl-carrier-protein]-phospholipid O-acyltransferase/long-chain-fatty-acid--[acyl-carrier-protein] ligase